MAGYFRKLAGHVYDGSHTAGEVLENGLFVEITANGVKKVTAAKDTVMRVAEITTLWGMPALVLDVVSVGENEVFLTEDEWAFNDALPYDTAKHSVPVGALVKMKRPLPGEQAIVTVAEALASALKEEDLVTPAANGTVAKKV